jgi:Cdc6-like AAA superfamily ATPase/S1-C subfamily serine protease
MSGGHGDHVDYGKEAIEVLIQFMENNDDSLVILAGYKTDMEKLIKNGNPGFERRFNGKESFINFEDYDDKALYQIFTSLIKKFETTPDFDDSVHRIISYMYLHRNARWGNAGEMEKFANTIINRHRGKKTPIDIEDIPDDKMRLIRDDVDENEILEDIESLIGLAEVKENLRILLRSTIGGRKEAKHLGKIESEKPDLNFIFEGNPGTGKTTVASKMARILYELGLIDEITPVEIDTEDLIKSTVGDTPKAVSQMFKDHSGKVIIIDEAYKLVNNGKSAIDEITKCLTDKRFEGNQALILAGYTKEMEDLLAMNSGMRRRFKNIWHFSDYTNEELWEIVLREAKSKEYKFVPEEDCKLLAFDFFEIERRQGNQFGNAGTANKLFKTVRDKYRSTVTGDNFDSILRPEHFPNFQSVSFQTSTSNERCMQNLSIPSNNIIEITLNDDIEKAVSDTSHLEKAVGLVSGTMGMGTGFLISLKERLVLTASHVIEGNLNIQFVMRRGNTQVNARLLWNNPTIDMALLQCDTIPTDARYFKIDSDVNVNPKLLENILHCGFLKGTNVSTNFSTCGGQINNYDPDKQLEDRHFDAILSNIQATNGCSGGPIMRASDYIVIGVLQGGFNNADIRVITDIHQLYKQKTLIIK